MSDVARSLLLERLLWPVPRVRWEAARGLARLIREGDCRAGRSLLEWVSGRALESEVVLGLSVIDAFDLGSHFDVDDVLRAVQAPSLLSDWIVGRNFPGVGPLSPFRYRVSPTERAELRGDEASWFERYRKHAVPRVFSCEVLRLQERLRQPLMGRWYHEWQWLQASYPRPEPVHPSFFSRGDRARVGQIDQGQRELYVSAYLRTLAYASIRGWITDRQAARSAMLGLTMTRGLADVSPIARPDWSSEAVLLGGSKLRGLARDVWDGAIGAALPNEVPLAVKVVGHSEQGFVECEVTHIVGARGLSEGSADVGQLEMMVPNDSPGQFSGPLVPLGGGERSRAEMPLASVVYVVAEPLGRLHADLMLQVKLASPRVFDISGEVRTGHSDIRLENGGEVLSRWVYWYSQWEPTVFASLGSTVGSMTTIAGPRLAGLCSDKRLEVVPMARVRKAVRERRYGELEEAVSETFWL